MPFLSNEAFEARFGAIVQRLFDYDRRTCIPGVRPNLIFRHPLTWPVIPLPGDFDGMCLCVDDYDGLLRWLGYDGLGPFDDGAIRILYHWFFNREARRRLWAPAMETLAGNGSGTAALFEPVRKPVLVEKDGRRKVERVLEDWRAVENRIGGGLPLDFDDWHSVMGDFVSLCDETGEWAIHSWGEARISYLAAEPSLMDRVRASLGGTKPVAKFIALDCAMNPEIDWMLDTYLDFFREPPFVEMPLRRLSTLDEHLEAHPWLDAAFADL